MDADRKKAFTRIALTEKVGKTMFREKKLSRYILISAVVHIIAALAMSRIYAESPQRGKLLAIVSAVKIQYKEPEPPPKPKVEVTQPKEKTQPKEEVPKVTPKPKEVVAPKVEQQKQRVSAPAPGLALESAPQRSRTARPICASVRRTNARAAGLLLRLRRHRLPQYFGAEACGVS